MVEDEIYLELVDYFKDSEDFRDQRKIVTFDEEELKSYKYFFLRSIKSEIKERSYKRVTCNDCRRDDSNSSYYQNYSGHNFMAAIAYFLKYEYKIFISYPFFVCYNFFFFTM